MVSSLFFENATTKKQEKAQTLAKTYIVSSLF
jgi:hypothetical protein